MGWGRAGAFRCAVANPNLGGSLRGGGCQLGERDFGQTRVGEQMWGGVGNEGAVARVGGGFLGCLGLFRRFFGSTSRGSYHGK